MKFIFLGSDILLYLLVAAVIIYIFWLRKHPHLKTPWLKVLKNSWGMSAAVILLIYFLVGFTDSIHFQKRLPNEISATPLYSPVVESLLDTLLWPLGSETEETYSAPLARSSFVKDTEENTTGELTRMYPPLEYAAIKVNAGDITYKKDLVTRSVFAVLEGLLLWLLLAFTTTKILQHRDKSTYKMTLQKICRNDYAFCWWSFLVTFFFIFLFLGIVFEFAFAYHLLGTDKVGNDVFYEAIKSIRTGLLIGSLTTLITLPFALIFGAIAGYFGGFVDDVLQYLYTTLSAIPGVLLIAAAILSTQVYMENHPDYFTSMASSADVRLLALCTILGITSWTGFCRIIRGETLKLRELDFVQAAKALGTSWHKILMKHILPNIFHLLIINVVLDFSILVLAEAVLTYVGVGVDPTMFSWGNMIDAARLELAREPTVWWPLLAAFIFMFIFVLAANLFAEAVRDAFDPKGTGR